MGSQRRVDRLGARRTSRNRATTSHTLVCQQFRNFPRPKVAPEDPSRFLAAHNPLTPSRETLPNRTTWSCLRTRDATVSVHLHLMQGPQHLALDRTKHVDCPPPAEKRKKQ